MIRKIPRDKFKWQLLCLKTLKLKPKQQSVG